MICLPGTFFGSPLLSQFLTFSCRCNFSGGILHITRLEKRHAGIYQCLASNVQGTTYGSAMLQVKPKQVTAQLALDNLPDVDETDMEGTVNLDHVLYWITPILLYPI